MSNEGIKMAIREQRVTHSLLLADFLRLILLCVSSSILSCILMPQKQQAVEVKVVLLRYYVKQNRAVNTVSLRLVLFCNISLQTFGQSSVNM